jgi:hypothetical protein
MIIHNHKLRVTGTDLTADSGIFIRRHRNNTIHRKIIEGYRATHPLCELCLINNETTPMSECHHIVGVAAGGATEPDNLMCLCRRCHALIEELPVEEQRNRKYVAGEMQ